MNEADKFMTEYLKAVEQLARTIDKLVDYQIEFNKALTDTLEEQKKVLLNR